MQTSDRVVGHWTSTNIGEAVPGVITPLGISQWGDPGHRAGWTAAYQLGVISRRERFREVPVDERVLRVFYGRVCLNLRFISTFGDRMPGVTGPDIMVSMFGGPPAGMDFEPTRRRYPFIATRLPAYFIRAPRRIEATCRDVDRWWRGQIVRIPTLDRDGAILAFSDAVHRFETTMAVQIGAMLGSIQPVFDVLGGIIERAGVGDLAVLSGTGGAEIAVVTDIWRASRGDIDLAEVVREHGFHGPAEGEISSRVWREDDTPLRSVIEHYRALPDSESPQAKEAAKEQRRIEMTSEVLAALPRRERPAARLAMKLARERIPGRGRAKRSFLQTIDVARMAARRAGTHLAAEGVLADPEDVFYLTGAELVGGPPDDGAALAAKRRHRRTEYAGIRFRATEWSGMPDVQVDEQVADTGDNLIRGTGASSGTVEGIVRVVEDPTFLDVEPGEVLVAPTTDPSWCSIMYVSAALVVDLGGMLSHAAVVARELDIPCVVATGDGTRRLRTGDRVRVDGRAGTVQIIARAPG